MTAQKTDTQTRMAAVNSALHERGIDVAQAWWMTTESLLATLVRAERQVEVAQGTTTTLLDQNKVLRIEIARRRELLLRAKETALIWAQQATIRNYDFDETLHADITAVLDPNRE